MELDSFLCSNEGESAQAASFAKNLEMIKRDKLSLPVYLEDLTQKLSQIRAKNLEVSKEETYAKILRLVGNCERIELDFDLLIGSKLGKYLHIAYVLLLEINDQSSLGYQRLLPRLSKLRKKCKDRIISLFKEKSRKAMSSHGNSNSRSSQEKIKFLMFNSHEANPSDNHEVVSLLDEEVKRPKLALVQESCSVKSSTPKRTRYYAKEQHILKTLYLSRLSQRSGSVSNLSLLSSSGSKLRLKRKRKKCKLEPFTASPSSFKKDMSLQEILKVKVEHSEMTKIRKRVCRKILSILMKEFNLNKLAAKKLTLAIESRINFLGPSETEKYLEIVKTLFGKIKVRLLLILQNQELKLKTLVDLAKYPTDRFGKSLSSNLANSLSALGVIY